MNDVVPMLTYADGPAAMDWLVAAFGFEEQTRWLDDEGEVAHGELRAGDGLVMVASTHDGYEGPTAHRAHCAQADAWLQSPYVVDGALVYVDDIDAHYARAVGGRSADPVADRGRRTRPALPHRGPRGAPLDVHAALVGHSGSSPRASSSSTSRNTA